MMIMTNIYFFISGWLDSPVNGIYRRLLKATVNNFTSRNLAGLV